MAGTAYDDLNAELLTIRKGVKGAPIRKAEASNHSHGEQESAQVECLEFRDRLYHDPIT